MTTWEAGTNDDRSRGKVAFDMYVVQTDEPNNRSLVRIAVGIFDNNGSYGGYGTGSWSIGLLGAQRASSSVYYDFSGSGPGWVWADNFWVDHNTDGSKWVDGWATFNGVSPVGSATASGGFWLTDYARPPYAPGAPSLARSQDGRTITITSQPADGRGLGITDYQYRWSSDGSSWSGEQLMGTGRVATFGPAGVTATQAYYFQTRAASSEGWGAWSGSSSIGGVAAAPGSIAVSRAGRNVTVTAGASPTAGVNGYWVQLSSDNGSTWSAAQLMSNQSYVYQNLTPAVTYRFRVYATNPIGYSAVTSSDPLFVPAGGKVRTGSQWVNTTNMRTRVNGGPWIDAASLCVRRGSSWVESV